MEPHHLGWLKAHPHRTEDWLRERLRDGFDVHHMDGDSSNNSPENLVLLDHEDHMRLHGAPLQGMRFGTPKWTECKTIDEIDPDYEIGRVAFWKKYQGETWNSVAAEFDIQARKIQRMAKRYRKSKRFEFDAPHYSYNAIFDPLS